MERGLHQQVKIKGAEVTCQGWFLLLRCHLRNLLVLGPNGHLRTCEYDLSV
jgi:hypothetical protein